MVAPISQASSALRVVVRVWSAATAQQKTVVQQREKEWVSLFDHTEKQKEDRARLLRGERLTAGEKRRRRRDRRRIEAETARVYSLAKQHFRSLDATTRTLEQAISRPKPLNSEEEDRFRAEEQQDPTSIVQQTEPEWRTQSTTAQVPTRSRWDGAVVDVVAPKEEDAGDPLKVVEDGETQEKGKEEEWEPEKEVEDEATMTGARRTCVSASRPETAGMVITVDTTIGRTESWCGKGKHQEQ